MLGLKDPLGDYVQNDKKIQELQKDLLARDLGNIEKYEAGDLTALKSENIQEFRTNLLEWAERRLAKVEMQDKNYVIRNYEEEKKIAAKEGQESRKVLDKLLKVAMPGMSIPEAEKSESYEESISREKRYTRDLIRTLKSQLRELEPVEDSSFSDPD
jgi:hypothetical protein